MGSHHQHPKSDRSDSIKLVKHELLLRSIIQQVQRCIIFLLLFALPTGAQNLPEWFQELLQKQINVKEDNLARLERGEAIARILRTKEKKEIATLGLVRVNTSGDLFVEIFRDIVNFKKSAAVLQIGKFSKPEY